MSRKADPIWQTLGHSLDAALDTLSGTLESLSSRRPSRPVSGALTAVSSALLAKGAKRWAESRRPRVTRLLRGAAAGAGAAGLLLAVRILLAGRTEEYERPARELTDELLAGAGRGVIYAALLDPYLPGPPLIRGALTGTADYLTAPWGGIFSPLQNLSPAGKLPVISILLETGDAEDDPYLAFLLHGAALGLLYGDGPRARTRRK